MDVIEPLPGDSVGPAGGGEEPGVPDPSQGAPELGTDLAAMLASVWERHWALNLSRVRSLVSAAAGLAQGDASEDVRVEAARAAHALAGSLGTFGLHEGTRLAREAEAILAAEKPDYDALSPIAAALLMELEHARADPSVLGEPVTGTTADTHGGRVLLVSEDTALAMRLSVVLLVEGIGLEVAGDPAAAAALLDEHAFAAALVDMELPDGGGLGMLGLLSTREPPVPSLALTESHAFADRIAAAQIGTGGILDRTLPPSRLAASVTRIVTGGETHHATVLAVDDDPVILSTLESILGSRGVRVVALTDPMRLWETLEETKPDLVIVDVAMPEVNGIDLCKAIRTDSRWQRVPILTLTASVDTETIRAAFAAGADDFVAKPVIGPELEARVTAHVERSRLLRTLVEVDPLTGVENRWRSEQALVQLIRLATRQCQPLAVAVLDIDRFKELNDRAGHAAGDGALRHVASLLRMTFRGEDAVGRWGGDEFVVAMYGMNADEAVSRLTAVIQDLGSRAFEGASELGATLSFSAGVAELPRDGSDLETLYRAADRALRRAKLQRGCALATEVSRPAERNDFDGLPPGTEAESGPSAAVLVVDDDETIRALVGDALRSAGHEVTVAADGAEALARIAEAPPDLVVSDVNMPDMDGFELVARMRQTARGRAIPLIFLTAQSSNESLVAGLALGADDYLRKPFEVPELLARVRAKLERRPVPQELLPVELRTGVLTRPVFVEELQRESVRGARSGRPGQVAVISCAELPRIRERLGSRAVAEIEQQLLEIVVNGVDDLEIVGRAGVDQFLVLIPECSPARAKRKLSAVAVSIASNRFAAAGESLRLTPAFGYAAIAGVDPETAIARAGLAASYSASHLDLGPRAWDESMGEKELKHAGRLRRWGRRLRVPFQIVAVNSLIVLPFLVYVVAHEAGVEIAPIMYLVVVAALLMTAALIWLEGFAALRATEPPDEPGAPYPPATAIIAAYLPNEAATILDTIDAFLELDYPADLQIILAYNTPYSMPVEDELRRIASGDPRLVPYRVDGSTSKAQNVNAALALTRGEFVGVFDADHHPQADGFQRAWRWLSNGYDVVQGHCQVRNGDASWVARMVAVEFEAIYAVSHPGRARLHGFGIFGGSNGYWRTQLLAETRMRGWMLTEDIDSSMRAIEAGHRIASDRNLVSRELAPATVSALWSQRMRWAQGWFQVALRHGFSALRSSRLTFRNKLGLFHLLIWREIYPWISLQMFPIIAYYIYEAGGPGGLNWLIPIFVLTTLFTVSTGPWQTYFAYRLGAPEIRERGRWFLFYLLISSFFYTEFKNVVSRLAQFNELMRDRTWRVTPRPGTPSDGSGDPGADGQSPLRRSRAARPLSVGSTPSSVEP